MSDNDGELRLVSDCMNGEECESGSLNTMGAVAEYVETDLCNIEGINCLETINLFSAL